MEMDWAPSSQACNKHLRTRPLLESTRQEEVRHTKKKLAPRPGGRRDDVRPHMGTGGEIGPGPRCLDSVCWRPIFETVHNPPHEVTWEKKDASQYHALKDARLRGQSKAKLAASVQCPWINSGSCAVAPGVMPFGLQGTHVKTQQHQHPW